MSLLFPPVKIIPLFLIKYIPQHLNGILISCIIIFFDIDIILNDFDLP